MVSDLVRQWYRRRFARRCAAVVTNSEHMAREFIANGVSRDRVCTLPPPSAHLHAVAAEPEDVAGAAGEYRLLFLGRLVTLKGGDLLLASLPVVRGALGRPIRVTFAGNGSPPLSAAYRLATSAGPASFNRASAPYMLGTATITEI